MITTEATASFIRSKLCYADWIRLQKEHQDKISESIDKYLERRQHQMKDPVMDFLFEYYAFRPSHLKRWSPGFGILLKGNEDTVYPELSELEFTADGASLYPAFFPDNRKSSLRWILNLLEKSKQKKPSFGCFGMHEWAMVYKREKVRHDDIPLRMDKEELAEFVESRPIVCTHFDAFRFFSPSAKPMNKHELSRDSFSDMEQAGCIHTNMDLYKWAFKGFPWISSKVIRESFQLAVKARIVDMKASPYNLRDFGLEPIEIETESGRMEYLEEQQGIYKKSIPIREQLIEEYRNLAEYFEL